MLMLQRLWGSDSRANEKSVDICRPMQDFIKPQPPVFPFVPALSSPAPSLPKRKRSAIEVPESPCLVPCAKRLKADNRGELAAASAHDAAPNGSSIHAGPKQSTSPAPAQASLPSRINTDRIREVVNYEVGHEILLRHNELRLIEQELAKCQIALEQLRRCHLIPYPVSCPTPEQTLEIMAGTGPALQAHLGAPVPQWAPPFGVVDGPYARHYAKWLIPDASFDGMQVDFHFEARQKGAEGRSTRNSHLEGIPPGKRTARGFTAPKLQSLSTGYPVKSDKAGPCTLVRQLDGLRVKLVCLDCNRENFSSTQGFINHCRIAHKRDYKSHEEAARKCGQAIGPEVGAPTVTDDKNAVAPATLTPVVSQPLSAGTSTGLVHPFASPNLAEQESYTLLKARISDCVKLFEDGLHPYSSKIPAAGLPSSVDTFPAGLVPSSQAPHLSALLANRSISKNLEKAVQDAKRVEMDDISSEDSEDGGDVTPVLDRGSGVMRVPARAQSPAAPHLMASTRPTSSKGRSHLPFGAAHIACSPTDIVEPSRETPMRHVDELGGDLSPNTMSSNNAPSLVSDDGEYEDSEMPSDSEAGESMAGNSVSDLAEISLEDESEGRPIRHHQSSSGAGPETVRLKRDDVKHVTFVSPIKGKSTPSKNPSHRVRKI